MILGAHRCPANFSVCKLKFSSEVRSAGRRTSKLAMKSIERRFKVPPMLPVGLSAAIARYDRSSIGRYANKEGCPARSNLHERLGRSASESMFKIGYCPIDTSNCRRRSRCCDYLASSFNEPF